jgi:hypothetical protein
VSLFRNGGVTRYRVDHDVAEEVDRVVINAEHERPDCGGLQPKYKPYLLADTIGAELDIGRLIGGGAILRAASSDAQPVGTARLEPHKMIPVPVGVCRFGVMAGKPSSEPAQSPVDVPLPPAPLDTSPSSPPLRRPLTQEQEKRMAALEGVLQTTL